jgi:hypothetical protein
LHASVAEPQAKLERDYAAWSNPVREKEREAETKHGKGGHGLTRATKRQIVVDNCHLAVLAKCSIMHMQHYANSSSRR